MKCNHSYIILLLLPLLLSSCQEKIDLELDNIPPAIVVQGRITNSPNMSYVRVATSSPYLSDMPNLPVSDALVILTEDGLVSDTLKYYTGFSSIVGVEGHGGYYRGPLLESGKIGSIYTLTVLYEGVTYTAVDTMRPVAPIDSLTYRYIDKANDWEDGYYVSLHMQEPLGLGNHYQWTYRYNYATQYSLENMASDEWVDGNYITIEFETAHIPGDTVSVEMASISAQYFTFVTQLLNQETFGDLFDTPPANVRGNISNGAFGYWHAAGAALDTIVIN